MIRSLALGWIAVALSAVAAFADGPSDAEIQAAISRGVSFLKDQQEPDGGWSYRYNHDHALGITALAGLALMENGVDRDDPALQKADRVVRSLVSRTNQTYDLALAILFLARRMPGSRGADDELIEALGKRLAAGQREGMWSYLVPQEDQTERRRRSVNLGGPGDNSNTQFALLGIWTASRHGLSGDDVLAAIDEHFRSTQNRDGGWPYGQNQSGSPAMSCAGLMGLAISAARPKLAEKQTARARGAALAADPAFVRGLKVVADDFRSMNAQSDIYYLWSIERVCVALGLKQLGGVDWYANVASELLRRQKEDGSWPNNRWGTLPDTCLALLVLRKANLAFELDRVLKLPDPRAAREPDIAPVTKLPVAKPASDDAIVTIRQDDEKNFPEIGLDFELKRPDGSAILDARKDDFRVTEYDRPVEILRFLSPLSKETRPTTVVLVLDHSKSMEDEDRIGGLKRAVASFLKNRPPGSRIAVIAFGSEVDLICPFTDDAAKVQKAVDAIGPAGLTRYYDAVGEAIRLLSRETGRRAILAMTDGEDTFSKTSSLDSVVADARREGLPIHTLGLGSDDEIESASLKKLALDTRGQAFSARQADALSGIFEEIARGLGQSYSLSFRTDRKLQDGTLRPIKVFYRKSTRAGETSVYIPGMVVQKGGWSWLFLVLVFGLGGLVLIPGWKSRKAA